MIIPSQKKENKGDKLLKWVCVCIGSENRRNSKEFLSGETTGAVSKMEGGSEARNHVIPILLWLLDGRSRGCMYELREGGISNSETP